MIGSKHTCYLVFLVFLNLHLFSCNSAKGDRIYPYNVFLDRHHAVQLRWSVDYQKEIVRFQVEAKFGAEKWFGIGFSDYGDTELADFAVFWTKDNVHHFQDTWTDENGLCHVDRKQDYILTHAHSGGGKTTLEFDRKFDTCDDHDYIFDTGTTHILCFISTIPVTSLEHVNVTAMSPELQRVQLLKPDIKDPELPSDVWILDVTAPNVAVPAQETTYWWYITQLPPLPSKQHIVKYEGKIDEGNGNLVHHMEVFHCEVGENETVPDYNGPGLAEGKPPGLEACRNVIGAWAMGAKPLVFPEDAGQAVGGDNFSRYVLLEVHYNNPDMKAGMIDSSGIRFYVTSQLRPYDAGTMELGLEYTNKMAIPPGQNLFLLTGYCISTCTEIGLPQEGIRVFASQLHTHLTGRKVYTRHIRNGVELPVLNIDNHYSPHFQEIRALPKQVHLLPGDALITTCEDRTVDRENATIGGFAISDEMCVNYMHYYPKVDLEVCKSSIDTEVLQNYFRLMNRWDGDPTAPGQGDRANYNAIRWTPLNVLMLKALYATSPLSMQCNKSDGSRFPGDWEGVPLTTVDIPLPPSRRSCPAAPWFGFKDSIYRR